MGAARVSVKFVARGGVAVVAPALLLLLLTDGRAGAQVAARPATPEIPAKLPPGYVVAPFENASNLANLEWMRIGVPAALSERLERHPGLRPLGGTLLVPQGAPPVYDQPSLLAYAQAHRARYLFTGAVARTDWKLELTVRLWRVEADSLKELGVWNKVDDFGQSLAMVDAAAIDLVAKAGLPMPASAVNKLAEPPTGDFYAFTLYGRGLYALHGVGKKPDLAKAEKDLAKAVFIDPKMAEAHYLLALYYLAAKQPGKARGRLAYALDLRPDYYAPLRALAQDAAREKKRGEAIDLCARALALRPWDLEVRLLLGEQLWEEGDVDGAGLELSRVIKVDAKNLPARRLLVLVHAARGQNHELAAELEEIVKLDPSDEAAKLDLGAAYHALGKDDKAIAIYTQVVADNPKQQQALKFLGDIHRARGELQLAIEWYWKALKANNKDPRPYFLLGSTYAEAKEWKMAIKIYKAAQKFPKYLGDAEANLGAIYLELGEVGQAVWYLKNAAKRRPASPRVHYDYGLALTAAKKYDEALAALEHAAELDPKDADTQFALGVVLLRLGRLDDAEKAFKKCAELDPKHEDALHNLQLIDDLRRRAQEGEVVTPG